QAGDPGDTSGVHAIQRLDTWPPALRRIDLLDPRLPMADAIDSLDARFPAAHQVGSLSTWLLTRQNRNAPQIRRLLLRSIISIAWAHLQVGHAHEGLAKSRQSKACNDNRGGGQCLGPTAELSLGEEHHVQPEEDPKDATNNDPYPQEGERGPNHSLEHPG